MYCAHCGKELPVVDQEVRKFRHRNEMGNKVIEAALCKACQEGLKNEGYEQVNRN
jgi:hypothetical protein